MSPVCFVNYLPGLYRDFPTVSYQNCWLESVRWDLTEAPKGSSYAKHCILLIAFAVEIGSEKIPLPAPEFLSLDPTSRSRAIWHAHRTRMQP
jgi:hypothetical protein